MYEELLTGTKFFIHNNSKYLYESVAPYTKNDSVSFVNEVRMCGLFYCASPEEIYKVGDEAKYLYFIEAITYQDKIIKALNTLNKLAIDNINFCNDDLLDQINAVNYVNEILTKAKYFDEYISKPNDEKVKSKSIN